MPPSISRTTRIEHLPIKTNRPKQLSRDYRHLKSICFVWLMTSFVWILSSQFYRFSTSEPVMKRENISLEEWWQKNPDNVICQLNPERSLHEILIRCSSFPLHTRLFLSLLRSRICFRVSGPSSWLPTYRSIRTDRLTSSRYPFTSRLQFYMHGFKVASECRFRIEIRHSGECFNLRIFKSAKCA